jgi:hypothetical protein
MNIEQPTNGTRREQASPFDISTTPAIVSPLAEVARIERMILYYGARYRRSVNDHFVGHSKQHGVNRRSVRRLRHPMSTFYVDRL